MSSQKRFVLSPLLAIGLLAVSLTGFSDEIDPVLQYYWQKAGDAAPRYNPNVVGIGYRLTARSFRHSVTRDGRITKTDTVIQNVFFTNGVLDSIKTVQGDDRHLRDLDLTHPSIFEMDYHTTLFPNDTGGVGLAIGLMADSTRPGQPDGLAVIDRYHYHLRALYLCYPVKRDYRRFTRAYRFALVDDYLFPDSVWEVATRLGIFSVESYRLEIGLTDIQIWQTDKQSVR